MSEEGGKWMVDGDTKVQRKWSEKSENSGILKENGNSEAGGKRRGKGTKADAGTEYAEAE